MDREQHRAAFNGEFFVALFCLPVIFMCLLGLGMIFISVIVDDMDLIKKVAPSDRVLVITILGWFTLASVVRILYVKFKRRLRR